MLEGVYFLQICHMTNYLGFWYFGWSFFSCWGCFLGFLNFRNHFWNLHKKIGMVYFFFKLSTI